MIRYLGSGAPQTATSHDLTLLLSVDALLVSLFLCVEKQSLHYRRLVQPKAFEPQTS